MPTETSYDLSMCEQEDTKDKGNNVLSSYTQLHNFEIELQNLQDFLVRIPEYIEAQSQGMRLLI